MGSAASATTASRKSSQFREFSYYRKEFIHDKEAGLSNEQLFDGIMAKKKEDGNQRGSCPDITYARQISNDSGPQSSLSPRSPDIRLLARGGTAAMIRFNSDLGLAHFAEKRRRGMVLGDKMSSSKRNFMKSDSKNNGNVSNDKREAAAIVMTALRKFFFIGEDSFDRMPMVLEGLEMEKMVVDDWLIKKGEEGDKMYVIISGSLEVMNDDEVTVKIQLSHGDLVGEVALVYNEKRMASVRVKEAGTLFSLTRSHFRELQAMASTSSIVKRCTWLHSVVSLSGVSFFAVSRLAQGCREIVVEPGEVVVEEGRVCGQSILIEEGVLEVTSEKIKDVKLCYKVSESYGEESKEENGEIRDTSATELDTAEAVGSRVLAGAGSFFGEGLLQACAGLTSEWVPDEGGAIAPITVKNCSSFPVKCSVFTISELVASVGGTQSLASFIVDNEMVATRRKGNKEVLKSYKVEDFDTVGFLGQGSFGSVKLVRSKEKEASPLPDEYALKSMSKEYIYSSGQVDHTLDERKIVVTLSHPNVLKVFSTFQSCDELFLLSEYIAGCDLWSLIHSDAARTGESHGLPPPFVKFYTANIVEGLGHIHSKGIAYRDLKPENVMVDADGYLKIIDFGFAKKIPFTVEIEGSVQFMPKSHTMCGTPEYLAPEFITSEGHDHTADLWALGVMIHELVMSSSPFSSGGNMTALFTNIVTTMYGGVKISKEFDEKAGGPLVANLIRGLCAFKGNERLGGKAQGMDEVKGFALFADFDFDALVRREMSAPWKPHPDELDGLREQEEVRDVEPYTGDEDVFASFG